MSPPGTLPIIRSDTQGSTRSLRGSLRSKIGKNKNKEESNIDEAEDFLAGANKKTDDGSPKSPKPRKPGVLSGSAMLNTTTEQAENPNLNSPDDSIDSVIPPPSPIHSGSIGKGHHALDNGNSREVDHVSDAPAGAGASAPVPGGSQPQTPRDSILVRRPNQPNPISTPNGITDGNINGGATADPMQMSALKSIDLDDMITRLLDAGYAGKVTKGVCLKNAEIQLLCQAARELFLSQPALVELSAPVKIVGDVHGQFTDLIRMFEMSGFPPNANYLFLGDYVDRGKQSLETILLLLCYKVKWPENFFLLRGNHECANVTRGSCAPPCASIWG